MSPGPGDDQRRSGRHPPALQDQLPTSPRSARTASPKAAAWSRSTTAGVRGGPADTVGPPLRGIEVRDRRPRERRRAGAAGRVRCRSADRRVRAATTRTRRRRRPRSTTKVGSTPATCARSTRTARSLPGPLQGDAEGGRRERRAGRDRVVPVDPSGGEAVHGRRRARPPAREVAAAFVEFETTRRPPRTSSSPTARGDRLVQGPADVRFVTEWPMSATKVQRFRLATTWWPSSTSWPGSSVDLVRRLGRGRRPVPQA